MRRVPLTPGTQDEEHGIQASTIITAESRAPQWVPLPWGEAPARGVPPTRQACANPEGLSLGRSSSNRLLGQSIFANRTPSKQPAGRGSQYEERRVAVF
jgi:hypothetical protein